jgi:hypothetical protein
MPTGITVLDLKLALKDLPDDMRVILQSDSEGNGYRWCSGANADGVLIEDEGIHAEIYTDSWSADDAAMDEDKWKKFLANPKVLVIFPV